MGPVRVSRRNPDNGDTIKIFSGTVPFQSEEGYAPLIKYVSIKLSAELLEVESPNAVSMFLDVRSAAVRPISFSTLIVPHPGNVTEKMCLFHIASSRNGGGKVTKVIPGKRIRGQAEKEKKYDHYVLYGRFICQMAAYSKSLVRSVQ